MIGLYPCCMSDKPVSIWYIYSIKNNSLRSHNQTTVVLHYFGFSAARTSALILRDTPLNVKQVWGWEWVASGDLREGFVWALIWVSYYSVVTQVLLKGYVQSLVMAALALSNNIVAIEVICFHHSVTNKPLFS